MHSVSFTGMSSVTKRNLPNVIVVLFIGITVFAQEPTLAPTPDKDPSVGVWLKNMKKSQPIRTEDCVLVESYISQTVTRDGEDIVVSEQDGPSRWVCRRGSVDYKAKVSSLRFRCDGNLHREESASISCKYTAPNVFEGKTMYDRPDLLLQRHKTLFWRTEVSSDGKEMKDTGYKDAAMTKPTLVTVFDRAK